MPELPTAVYETLVDSFHRLSRLPPHVRVGSIGDAGVVEPPTRLGEAARL
ncbi:hypothetical protein [Haloarcula nitratireducens]|uniref:Uncharacterized protein n=1 Tax=Haloarcula nitratireducens TaxID=2487749 RepID=A0AAW4PAS9_9EURY|nr:hypothetical protein [Halomicroarcula nitratireducens]MBX0294908.1 hypothetical protein [Halomicroarcula nitratireducens]